MKQVIQSVRTGELSVAEVPVPSVRAGGVLVRTHASLVSAGTERNVVSFAEKNLLDKARSRPDLVRQTLEKAKRDGVLETFDAVRNRLDQPLPLGYSMAGVVLSAGAGVTSLKPGDRVACAGAGFANHAEVAWVPKNLTALLPDEVSFEHGAFANVGAIAMHGLRIAEPRLGEIVAVIGLGLLGQLTVQMLKAAGCVVIGTDLQADRVALARELGADAATTDAEEFAGLIQQLSDGYGADAVLITADARSDQPVALAGEIARDRGRVIAVGLVGTALPRKPYFEKELDFRVSRSAGPGRYDPSYEEQGNDYPYGFVRWTEQRNMASFLQLIARGSINLDRLITHRFDIAEATRAYDLILGRTAEPSLGVLLRYPAEPELTRTIRRRAVPAAVAGAKVDKVRLGVLGAGLFANATMLPVLKAMSDVELVGIASGAGLSARAAADRFDFAFCSSDGNEVMNDPRINTVAILTRHDLHAGQVETALARGKHVFVEKPLCLEEGELPGIIAAYERASSLMLTVGFNRRFAPFVVKLKESLRTVTEPLLITCRVNGGWIPPEHWIHDPATGGGRLRAEGCHFLDLISFLAGSDIAAVTTRVLPDSGRYSRDNFVVTAELANGSLGSLVYAADGDRGLGKELIEVFGGGLAARIDDYRLLEIYRGKQRISEKSRLRSDKGHRDEWRAIVRRLVGGGPDPIPFHDLLQVTRATIAAQRSMESGRTVLVEAAAR